MKKRMALAALGALALLPGLSCATKTRGQLILAVQSDMAMPKDIDRIRIELVQTDSGAVIYQKDFEKLGADGSIKLPGTLVFYNKIDEPTGAIRVRVIASHGPPESARVLREVVTRIPDDRVATLPVTIEFLCTGSGTGKRDAFGNLQYESTCPEGLTCIAGTCASAEMPPETLRDYDETEVFNGGTGEGDGTCFDTTQCFEESQALTLDMGLFKSDMKSCQAAVSGDVNVALLTEGAGICGSAGCFVPLDADSDAGWRSIGKDAAGNTTIALPKAVCEKVQSGEIVAVVSAKVGAGACALKGEFVPVCGPWSSVGASTYVAPDPLKASLVASGQINPASLALARVPTAGGQSALTDNLYWVSRGTFDMAGSSDKNASVKAVTGEGGQPTPLAVKEALLGSLALDVDRGFALWTRADASAGEIVWAPLVNLGAAPGESLLGGLAGPTGVAAGGDKKETYRWVYVTEAATQSVYRLRTVVDNNEALVMDADKVNNPARQEIVLPSPAKNPPGAVAAAQNAACWVYGTSGDPAGVVACALHTDQTAQTITDQLAPRSLVLRVDSNNVATAVIWSSFGPAASGGGVFEASITEDANGLALGPATMIVAEDDVGGLALDPGGTTLYWTSRLHGTVMSTSLVNASQPVLIADGQSTPGAIVASKDTVYWLDEGQVGSVPPSGALMKIRKP